MVSPAPREAEHPLQTVSVLTRVFLFVMLAADVNACGHESLQLGSACIHDQGRDGVERLILNTTLPLPLVFQIWNQPPVAAFGGWVCRGGEPKIECPVSVCWMLAACA